MALVQPPILGARRFEIGRYPITISLIEHRGQQPGAKSTALS
jgi:hypothetical protein